jgi:predicted metal-binding protein
MKLEPVTPIKEVPISKIKEDLNRYERLAAELGATHVKILGTNEIILDYRVRYKCMVPKCRYYNTNANCPPHAPSLESTKKFIACFSDAILTGLKVPSTSVLKSTGDRNHSGTDEKTSARRRLSRIVSAIESEAYYDGYYFATAFTSGHCKGTLCVDLPCQALENGKGCRHPLESRPSMEGVGMDVFQMVSNAGWPIYPVGRRCQAEDIPFGMLVGIILIC